MSQFRPDIPLILSPNRSSRKGVEIDATVIHCTASGKGAKGDIDWMCDPLSRVSAHFMVDRDGAKTQLVPLEEKAWHAGASELVDLDGSVRENCNKFTIGIELDNYGLLHRAADGAFLVIQGEKPRPYIGPPPVEGVLIYPNGQELKGWWEPYPDVQIDSLSELLLMLADAGYREAVHNIVGHDEIAVPVGRKCDPGMFPWERFSRRIPLKVKRAFPLV